MSKELNRRQFIGLGTVAAAGLLIGCESKKRTLDVPPFRDNSSIDRMRRSGNRSSSQFFKCRAKSEYYHAGRFISGSDCILSEDY